MYSVKKAAEWYAEFYTQSELEDLMLKEPENGYDQFTWEQIITMAYSFRLIEDEINSKEQ